jgi:hypothetical protein
MSGIQLKFQTGQWNILDPNFGPLNLPMVVSAQRQILGGGLAPLRPEERTPKIISYTEYQQVQFRFLDIRKSDQDRLLLRYYVE